MALNSPNEFWKCVPKIELHCHLEGSCRYPTLLDAYRRLGMDIPVCDVDAQRKHFVIEKPLKTFDEFLVIMNRHSAIFKDQHTIRRVAREVVIDKANENVVLLELRYPPVHLAHMSDNKLALAEIHSAVVNGVEDGIAEAARNGHEIHVYLVCSILGSMKQEDMDRTVIFLLQHRRDFVGVDLTGGYQDLLAYDEPFTRLRDAGINITVHASANGPATEARTAVERLHASRIGHATRILEDPDVYRFLKDKHIPLEIAVTSVYLSSDIKQTSDHPVKKFCDDGFRISINTDDPGICDINLNDEYKMLHYTYGFTYDDFMQINKNALATSFAPEPIKSILTAKYFPSVDRR